MHTLFLLAVLVGIAVVAKATFTRKKITSKPSLGAGHAPEPARGGDTVSPERGPDEM